MRLLWDECMSHRALKFLRARHPEIDIVTVAELGFSGADDRTLIDWALANDRVIVTRDRPLAGVACDLLRTGTPVRAIIVDDDEASPRRVADELTLIAHASRPEDWNGPIFLPLQ